MTYRLDPSRALLHPAWLGSLGVLALNDHLLKGADLLPAALTGKLSDVAGMLVAPLLLAAIVRVRSRRGWIASHVAVGLVFAAIQVSAAAATAWGAVMEAIGFPWVITRDLGDLVVLPVLALSAWGFLPAMRRKARANARRTAELGAASVGLLCCVATSSPESDPEPWPEEPPFEPDEQDSEGEWQELPDINADLYINNATGETQLLRIRALRGSVQLDCDAVEEAPGGLLRSELFEPAQAWTIPANANIPVQAHASNEAPCYAAWVESDVMQPVIVWWRDRDPNQTWLPGEGQQGLPGELLLESRGAQGLGLWDAEQRFLHDVAPVEPETAGECAHQPDGDRIAWSTPVPFGPATITQMSVGVDGCIGLDLERGLESFSWYLCVPLQTFPFAQGDHIDITDASYPTPSVGVTLDGLEIRATDTAGNLQEFPSLVVAQGSKFPSILSLSMGFVPLFDCESASEATCGTVARPVGVVVGGSELTTAELRAGPEVVQLTGGGRLVDIALMHAQERFVLDPECALGPEDLGYDLEMAIAQRAALEG